MTTIIVQLKSKAVLNNCKTTETLNVFIVSLLIFVAYYEKINIRKGNGYVFELRFQERYNG